MDKLLFYTDDVLRVMHNQFPDRAKSVDVIIHSYFRFTISSKFCSAIEKRIIDNNWAVPTEDSGLLLTPLGEEYIESLYGDEYLIDRIFEYVKDQNSPTIIDEILRTLQFHLEEPKIKYIEAVLVESEFIDSNKSNSAFHYSLKINTKGLIVLSQFNSYSEYKSKTRKFQMPEISPHAPIINQTINVAGNMQSSGNFNSSISHSPNPQKKSLWNTTVLIWIGVASALIATLILFLIK